jgi:PIN domain nuclease of toxin-antitoxin system
MNIVLDASALLAFLHNEPGADVVEGLLLDPDTICHAHAVNLCEVFYKVYRAGGEADARSAITRLVDAGVHPREEMDTAFWHEVGRLKAARNLPLADCFCIVLAQRQKAEAVTADHPDFDPIVPLGLCVVRFIR